MRQFGARAARARTRWLAASLLVVAVVLSACSGSTLTASRVAGSTSAGSTDTAAGTGPGPGASPGGSPASDSGTSASQSAPHPGSPTKAGASAARPATSSKSSSASGHATPAPGSSAGSDSSTTDSTTDPSATDGSSDGSDPSVTIGGFTSSPGATPSPVASCNPTVPPVQQVGITDARTARVNPDGSITFTTSFSSAADTKIMAVLGLDSNVAVAGAVITFVRIFGCKYTPSQTYTLTKPLTHFEVEFSAGGQPFTPGHYRLRFYLNNKAGADISYDIH
jgi:hypothetical protein